MACMTAQLIAALESISSVQQTVDLLNVTLLCLFVIVIVMQSVISSILLLVISTPPGGTAAAAPPTSGLATLLSVGAVP